MGGRRSRHLPSEFVTLNRGFATRNDCRIDNIPFGYGFKNVGILLSVAGMVGLKADLDIGNGASRTRIQD